MIVASIEHFRQKQINESFSLLSFALRFESLIGRDSGHSGRDGGGRMPDITKQESMMM
jgi:hypothetical protein